MANETRNGIILRVFPDGSGKTGRQKDTIGEGQRTFMQGIYKTKLEESQLEAAVRAAFGCTLRSSAELGGGWANSAYSLLLDDGRRAVLKARPASEVVLMRCEVESMRTEVEAMRLFEGAKGLTVPRVYAYDASKELLPVEYFIMEYMEGQPLNKVKGELSEEQLDAVYRQLGGINRRINEVKGTGYGYFVRPTADSWRKAFAEIIYGALADGRDMNVELPIAYSEMERLIEERLDALDEVAEPRLLHWDLWDGNVFVKDGQVCGVTDFERCLWGDPLMEYYFGRFHGSLAFREGYGLLLNEPAQIARRKLYDLYLDLLLYIECAFRKYEDRHHIQWTIDNLAHGLDRFRA